MSVTHHTKFRKCFQITWWLMSTNVLHGLFSSCCNAECSARAWMGGVVKWSCVCFKKLQLSARGKNLKKLKINFEEIENV